MKERKAFLKYDILLYLVLTITVVLLFVFFVILPDGSTNVGFGVYLGETKIFSFYYENETYDIAEGYDIQVESRDNIFTVTVKTEYGFNILQADTEAKTVKVIDADCSIKKDCVYSAPISGNVGAIICVPHNLRIIPLGDGFVPPVAG